MAANTSKTHRMVIYFMSAGCSADLLIASNRYLVINGITISIAASPTIKMGVRMEYNLYSLTLFSKVLIIYYLQKNYLQIN
jgi:hypothetical protein